MPDQFIDDAPKFIDDAPKFIDDAHRSVDSDAGAGRPDSTVRMAPPVAPPPSTKNTASSLLLAPEALVTGVNRLAGIAGGALETVGDVTNKLISLPFVGNDTTAPAAPSFAPVAEPFMNFTSGVRDLGKKIREFEEGSAKKAKGYIVNELGANPESTLGKVSEFGGGLAGAVVKYANPYGMQLMALESGVGKTTEAYREGVPLDRAVTAGLLTGETAAAIGSLPGGDKAYQSLKALIAAKVARGAAMGTGFGGIDYAVDKIILQKDLTPEDFNKYVLEGVKSMVALELVGSVPHTKEIGRANKITKTYDSLESARHELAPRLDELGKAYTDTLADTTKSRTERNIEANKIKREFISTHKDLTAVDYAEKAKMPFKGFKAVESPLGPATEEANAIQERRPEEEISRPIGGGEDLQEGGGRIRPSEPGNEPPRARPEETIPEATQAREAQAPQEEGLVAGRRTEQLPVAEEHRQGERRQETTSRARIEQLVKDIPHMNPEEAQRAVAEITRMVHTDSLTGLGNQRAWKELLPEIEARGEHVGTYDAKGLKWINDTYGHQYGDAFLKTIGDAFKSAEHPEGFYRTGGDEFYTHATSPEAIREATQRVETYLAEHPIEIKLDGGESIKVSPRLAYGTGRTIKDAEEALHVHQEQLRSSGADAGRGSKPAGVSETAPQPQGDLNREPVLPESKPQEDWQVKREIADTSSDKAWEDVRATQPIKIRPDDQAFMDLAKTRRNPAEVADFLGGQQLYEKAISKLGLGKDPTIHEIATEIGTRIGKLGNTVKETSLKISSKFRELGRQVADKVAAYLHDVFGGTKEGQRGSLNYNSKKAMDEWMASPALEDNYAGYELRKNALEDITALGETSNPERAMKEINAKATEGTLDLTPKDKSPQAAAKTVRDFHSVVAALVTGDGGKDANGVPIMVEPMITKGVRVNRDLSKMEARLAKGVSPSHLLTGTYGEGSGAMHAHDLLQNDMVLAEAASFVNQQRLKSHFTDTMADASIGNHSHKIRKEMQPNRDALTRLILTAHNLETLAKEKSPAGEQAKAKLDALEPKIIAAIKNNDVAMKNVCAKYEDARVMAYAEHIQEPPAWLKPLMKPGEVEAATKMHNMMLEAKRALKAAGAPVIETGVFMPHLVKEGLSPDVVKLLEENRMKGFGLAGIEGKDVDPELIRFAHRSDRGGMMTLPDLWGAMDSYIVHASRIQARRTLANKWSEFTALNGEQYPNLTQKINADLTDYISPAPRTQLLDKANQAFMVKLIGWNPTTAAKHLAKIPLSVSELGVINSAKGLYAMIEGKARGTVHHKEIMATVDALKGNRYFSAIELGTGEVTADKLKSIFGKVVSSSHNPVQAVESFERTFVLYTSLLEGHRQGMTPEEAIKHAVSNMHLVNFSGVDKPPVLRGSVAQSAFFLQSTPWKLMELQIRRAGDLYKGIRGMKQAGGLADMDPVTRKRFAASLRDAAVIAGVMGLDKYLDTNLLAWTAHVPGLFKGLIEEPLAELYKSATDSDHEFNIDLGYTLKNSLSLVPGATSVVNGLDKYGMSSAFWLEQGLPNVALGLLKPAGKGKDLGDSTLERNIRSLTGQPVASEAEEDSKGYEHFLNNQQRRRSSKYMGKFGTENVVK